MSGSLIRIDVAGGSLLAVPALPFRVAFAWEVNAICRDAATRPDAIAVALGPHTARAARRWLRELGTGPACRRRLPVLIGLIRYNRLLHPATREAAIRLQREMDTGIDALSPEVLRRELGFTTLGLLPLSPTDSITEAVRCACELDVPLYGVDLDETACPSHSLALVEQLGLSCGDLAAYRGPNGERAGRDFDPVVDTRREIVTAARLKAVLRRHQRVLYTGGLRHWIRLRAVLEDASIAAATTDLDPGEPWAVTGLRRVVVHPSLAAHWLDACPAVAPEYEGARSHPRLGPGTRTRTWPPKVEVLFERAVLEGCSLSDAGAAGPVHSVVPLEFQGGANAVGELLCAVEEIAAGSLPDAGLVLSSVRARLSEPVCVATEESLMSLTWVTPEELPGAALLESARGDEVGRGEVLLTENNGERRHAFASLIFDGRPVPPAMKLSWRWQPGAGRQQGGRRRVTRGSQYPRNAIMMTTPDIGPNEPFAFDDEPLEAILYGEPSPGPSPADLFAPARPALERIHSAIASGRNEEALREVRTLLQEGHAFPEVEAHTFVNLVREFVPELPCPRIVDTGISYDAILGPIFEQALARGNDALVQKSGVLLYRWCEGCSRYGDARRVVSAMLSRAQSGGGVFDEAILTNNLGYEYLLEEDWDRAEPLFARALELFERQGLVWELANSQANLLICRFGRLGLPGAQMLEPEIQAVLKRLASQGDWRERKMLVLIARIWEYRGCLAEAVELVKRAIRCARSRPTRHRLEDAAYLSHLKQRLALEDAGSGAVSPGARGSRRVRKGLWRRASNE